MNLNNFNTLSKAAAREQLTMCCGAHQWVEAMLNHFPFSSEQALVEKATDIWYNHCQEADYLEAFSHHPKIGDFKSLQQKFAGGEQASITQATTDVIKDLAQCNEAYDAKNGFIFIVCATGKSAKEMLQLIEARLHHDRSEELAIAMGEQHKITLIRLKKLLPDAHWQWMRPSHLTTHVLDTALGRPGKDLPIKLQHLQEGRWHTVTVGITNADGRVPDLIPQERDLPKGVYKITFDTHAYFEQQQIKGFYPTVEIQFYMDGPEHYHVPLLISPYGYSTYRGS